jgi:hypothetical protein
MQEYMQQLDKGLMPTPFLKSVDFTTYYLGV